jgi:hypothetical protein
MLYPSLLEKLQIEPELFNCILRHEKRLDQKKGFFNLAGRGEGYQL